MTVNLPAWAELKADCTYGGKPIDVVLVDPDKMYPEMFAALGVDKPTKYWIEVAYQMMKMDLQVAMKKFSFIICVRGDDGRKDRWALSAHPGSSDDVTRATKGKEAREHYKKLRGFIPS